MIIIFIYLVSKKKWLVKEILTGEGKHFVSTFHHFAPVLLRIMLKSILIPSSHSHSVPFSDF